MATAIDREVLAFALDEQRIVVSADTDFGELLARSNASGPSIVLFRRQGQRSASEVAALLLANLGALIDDLATGAVVVFDADRVRVRRLRCNRHEDERAPGLTEQAPIVATTTLELPTHRMARRFRRHRQQLITRNRSRVRHWIGATDDERAEYWFEQGSKRLPAAAFATGRRLCGHRYLDRCQQPSKHLLDRCCAGARRPRRGQRFAVDQPGVLVQQLQHRHQRDRRVRRW